MFDTKYQNVEGSFKLKIQELEEVKTMRQKI
jgi:hypothetical protein